MATTVDHVRPMAQELLGARDRLHQHVAALSDDELLTMDPHAAALARSVRSLHVAILGIRGVRTEAVRLRRHLRVQMMATLVAFAEVLDGLV